MDLPCDSFLPKCDDVMSALFNDDSGLGMDFDFRNDGTVSPVKSSTPKSKKFRFLSENGTYARQNLIHSTNQDATDSVLTDKNVVGDGSRVCGLPTVADNRHDLKCISPETLAGVLRGGYDIQSYRIIDCRYPYEFQGGHIMNADNFHQTDNVNKLLPENNHTNPPVLIFHCEFSIERGPSMCRYLRQIDREANAENYPELFYPEVYILKGGYKSFYESFPELCTPEGYTPMLDQNYSKDLRHFRCKSKSWCVGQRKKPKKSLRLFD